MRDREAVARAICVARGIPPDEPLGVNYAWIATFQWELYLGLADAAIACLRERWTSAAALRRAFDVNAELLGQASITALLTAAMRDS